MQSSGPPSDESIRLPFDIGTVLAALWRRRYHFLAVFVVAGMCGAAGGYFLGKRTYEARTVLRYVPAGGKARVDSATVLRTELDQVEIPQNLSKVRFRLSLPATLEETGAAVSAHVEEQSALVTIQARWKTGRGAAAIANTLRDIYLENWLRAQVSELDRHYAQAKAELKTLDSQAEKLGAVVEDLRGQIAKEQEEAAQKSSRGAEVATRYSRLREAIAEDQARRANMADMALRELELERARKLREKDLIAPAEYEKAVAAYQRQRALTYDSGKIRQWREELEKLSDMAGTTPGGGSPTEMLLHATLLKSFDLDLKRVALAEKVGDLREARDRILEALDGAAGFEARIAAGQGTGPGAATGSGPYSPSIAETLSRVLGAHDIAGGSYEVVAEAEAPVAPVKSTRKLVAAAIAIVIGLLGTLGIVAREVLNPTLRSASEVPLRLDLAPVGVLPHVRPKQLALPGDADSPMLEASRVLAERVRVVVPPLGACVLLTSAGRGDGRTVTASFLAGAFGRRGDRVLLVDADVREPRRKTGLDFLASKSDEPLPGLGDLLAGEGESIPSLIRKTLLPNVYLLPRGSAIPHPEPLGSRLMQDLLGYASRHYALVLLSAPPVLPNVDAGLLANWCHSVLLVVRAGRTRVTRVRRALKRLENYRVRVHGVILNDVQAPFVNFE